MSDKPKFPRAAALAVAKEICAALKPLTTRLIVAGSLRRGKTEVGDVEIVYLAQFGMVADPEDLLQQRVRRNLVDVWLDDGLANHQFTKRRKETGAVAGWGEECKYARHEASGIPVDFFGGNASNWWTLLVCRTGSAANNERICNAAIARGLKWDPYHGFRDRPSGKLLHVPQSERDVFARVGLPYLEPAAR